MSSNFQIFMMLLLFWKLGIDTGRRLEREGKTIWQVFD